MWFLPCLTCDAAFAADVDVLRFASGMRAVIEHRPDSHRTVTSMAFGAGEGGAPDGQEHVAHLAEHLWYRARGPAGPNGWVLRAWGCDANAYTELTQTGFLATCPEDATEALLDLEASRLASPLAGVRPEEVAIERDVIAIEVAQRAEGDAGAVLRAVVPRLDPDDPEGARVGRDGVGDIGLDEVRAWTAAHYTAREAVLAIVSSQPLDVLQPLLEARFGPVVSTAPTGDAVRAVAAGRATLRMDVRHAAAAVDEPMIVVSYEAPPVAQDALAAVLERGLAARFGRDARVAELGCGTLLGVRSHLVACLLRPRPGLPADQIDALARTVRATDVRGALSVGTVRKQFTADREGLARALDQVGDSLLAVPYSYQDLLARWMLAFDRVPDPSQLEGRVPRAAARALQRAAVGALDPQRALALVLDPAARAPDLPPARAAVANDAAPAPAVPALPALAPVTVRSSTTPQAVVVQRTDLLGPHVQPLAVRTTGRFGWLLVSPDPPDTVAVPAAPAAQLAPAEALGAGVRFAARPDDAVPLTSLLWVCPVHEGQDAAAQVLAELLEAWAVHRLREVQGWSYSPEAGAIGDVVALGAEVLDDAAPDAIGSLRAVIDALGRGELAPDALAAARRRAAVHTSTPLATVTDWPSVVVGPAGWRDPAAIAALSSRVSEVEASDVASLARSCAEAAQLSVVGPPALEAEVGEP
ncbi:MAG: hypothetical protein R3F59_30980 [Myxococcota bacterium]